MKQEEVATGITLDLAEEDLKDNTKRGLGVSEVIISKELQV
jgi:hypothetical protein